MAARMGVAVAVLYDSGADEFLEFTQDQVPHLITRLREAELVVGFNSKRFDYKVLAGVHPFDPDGIPSLDMLEMVRARLGYRLSLANLARATLGAPKTGDGLQSLEWWKQGRVDKIAEYCRQDVALTRDLYLFGLDCGHLLFTNKAGRKVRLPLDWNQRP
jgi:DEAD/DEAH box helicase domain-containing protein